jgi:hypothetical protein
MDDHDQLVRLRMNVNFALDRLQMLAVMNQPADPTERARIQVDHDRAWQAYTAAVDAYQAALRA